MTAREFLRQSLRNYRKLNCTLEQILNLQDTVGRLTPLLTNKIPSIGGKTSSVIENAVVNFIDESAILSADVIKYLETRAKIADAISVMVNEDERLILQYRYLSFTEWKKIAKEMHISQQRAYQLHNQALKSFENVYAALQKLE